MNHLSRWKVFWISVFLLSSLGSISTGAQTRNRNSTNRTGSLPPVSFNGPVLQLDSAHITVRLPDRFTVKEKEGSNVMIVSPEADWTLNVGSLGAAKTFDEAMVGMLSVITRAFRPESMSETPIQKLPNRMASKQFTGIGLVKDGGVAWTAHIIQVKEKEFVLTLATFNIGAEGQKNLKKNLGIYLQIVSKITTP